MYATAVKKPNPKIINTAAPKTVGFIVNPIAGMGGSVGLKGTDGKEILEKAIALRAKPLAPARAESFLSSFKQSKRKVRLLVGAGLMGEDEAKKYDFAFKVIGNRKKETTANDTINTANKMADKGTDLLVFCGGDGTARDIKDAIDIRLPVLGVPTGVKMYSAVFAVNPKAAARLSTEFLWERLPLREAEVMDVDEEAFRNGRLSARLHGYMLTPYEPSLIQGIKMASPMIESEMRNQAAIAIYVNELMKTDVIYILGPGTTTRTLADLLEEEKTLLGVDLLCNKKIVAKDVNEEQIIEEISGKTAKIIVTPIGGQGFILGRGNQQISPKVIRQVGRKNIIVVATKTKLKALKSLKVDSGDPDLDKALRGHIKVVCDYGTERNMRVN